MKSNPNKVEVLDDKKLDIELLDRAIKIFSCIGFSLKQKQEMIKYVELATKVITDQLIDAMKSLCGLSTNIYNEAKALLEKRFNIKIEEIKFKEDNSVMEVNCKKGSLSKTKVIN